MTNSMVLTQGATLFQTVGAILGNSELSLHAVEILLRVAAADAAGAPMDSREIAQAVNLSTSAVSRNIAALGEWHRGRAGMGLVEARPDLADRRRKPVRLTRRGKLAVNLLRTAMQA